MKQKEMITYIKSGEEFHKQINFFNRMSIILSIFEHPFNQQNNWDYYKIKNDISFLHLKNVTFYRDVKFYCSKNTILILEDCNFKGANLSVFGGSVQVINPNLSCAYYRNNIFGQDLEDFSLDSKTNSSTFLTLSIYSKHIKIDGENRIDRIHLIGEKIMLQNVEKLHSLYICGSEVTLKNTELDFFDPELVESSDKKSGPCIYCDTLEVQNLVLSSCYSLEVKCKKIVADKKSRLCSNYDVVVGNDIYKNKKSPNALLCVSTNYLLSKPQEDISRQELLSLLKGVKKLTELEIKKVSREKEEKLFSDTKNKKVIPNPEKIKQRVKKIENGMYHHRKIKTYSSF